MIFDWDDSDFRSAVNNSLSCLLPHCNYDGRYFTETLRGVFKYIRLDEMSIEYRVIFKALEDLSKITVQVEGFIPKLELERLKDVVGFGLDDLIAKNNIEVSRWLSTRGVEFNYAIPEQVMIAKETLYNEIVNLYQDCYDIAIDSSQFPAILITLKQAIKSNANTKFLQNLYEIKSQGLKLNGKSYMGDDDFLNLASSYTSEMEKRLLDAESDVIVLDDISKIVALKKFNEMQTSKICDFGIPDLDDYTPILRSRLQVVVGGTNTGKTLYACWKAAKIIMSGHRVAIYCGESPANKIMNMILSNIIYHKEGKFVTSSQISGQVDVAPEMQRLINIHELELAQSGLLQIIDYLTYENVYDDLRELYTIHKFDAVIIDHSSTLSSSPDSRLKNLKDKIDAFAYGARRFKRDFPVNVTVTSHPSTEAAAELKKYGYVISDSTKASTELDKEADELFVLHNNETLIKQGMIKLQVKKRRDWSPPLNQIMLKQIKSVCEFEYKDEYQEDLADKLNKDQALLDIKQMTDLDDEGIEIDLLDDFD